MTQLAGKTAVILGASSAGGIGDAIARLFVAEGANVVISGRKQAPLLSLAKDIKAEVKTCDITDEAEIEALFGAAKDSYGGVDIAVNAAGVNLPGPIASITREDLQMLCDIHFIGGTLFIKQAAAAMGEGGSIITLSSVTAELTGPNLAGYGATKAAVDKVVKVAAIEYGPKGIRVNSISPSLTNTPMTSKVFETPSMVAAFEKETPLGRLVTAQDVAHTALYLANDKCVATGDNIRVSGGAHLRRLPTYQEMMNT